MGLSDGGRISMMCSAVLTQSTRVTDGRTDGTCGHIRVGPSFQLGTLSTRIANLLCMMLVNVVT